MFTIPRNIHGEKNCHNASKSWTKVGFFILFAGRSMIYLKMVGFKCLGLVSWWRCYANNYLQWGALVTWLLFLIQVLCQSQVCTEINCSIFALSAAKKGSFLNSRTIKRGGRGVKGH